MITSVLFQDDDILLLDDATKFLDPPRILLLLQTCRVSLQSSSSKIVVLVSHDHDFIYYCMERITCTRTGHSSVSKEPHRP